MWMGDTWSLQSGCEVGCGCAPPGACPGCFVGQLAGSDCHN
jgi:hypothetical protein